MNEFVFTPAALLDVLRQIDELKDKNISLEEVPGQSIQLQIGESSYTIDTSSAEDVQVSSDVIEEIADVIPMLMMNYLRMML